MSEYFDNKPQGSFGQEPEAKRHKTLNIVIGVLIVGALACCGLFAALFFVVQSFTQPVDEQSKLFMEALQAEDYAQAYDRLSTDLQAGFGSAERMASLINEYNVYPQSWHFDSFSRSNDVGEVSGTVELPSGDQPVQLDLSYDSKADLWRIDYASFFVPMLGESGGGF